MIIERIHTAPPVATVSGERLERAERGTLESNAVAFEGNPRHRREQRRPHSEQEGQPSAEAETAPGNPNPQGGRTGLNIIA